MNNVQSEKFHITLSSYKSLTFQFNVKVNDVTIELCKQHYDNNMLKELLTHDDIKLLWMTRMLFDETKKEFIENSRKSFLNMDLIFDSNSAPKYHKNSECESLKNKYINFVIPPEIKNLGASTVLKFKKFAYDHRDLLRDDEIKFIDKISAQFLLVNPPKKLEYVNSGRYEFSKLSIDEMHNEVMRLTEQAVNLMNKHSDVYKNRYKPAKLSKNDSKELTSWLKELKPKLMEALYQYGIKKFGPSDFSFEKSFLEKFGFEPCRLCLSEKVKK